MNRIRKCEHVPLTITRKVKLNFNSLNFNSLNLNLVEKAYRGVSAEVGKDDRLDGQSADRTQLIPFLQLPGADITGHQVSSSSVDDAAILWPGLTNETWVKARVR